MYHQPSGLCPFCWTGPTIELFFQSREVRATGSSYKISINFSRKNTLCCDQANNLVALIKTQSLILDRRIVRKKEGLERTAIGWIIRWAQLQKQSYRKSYESFQKRAPKTSSTNLDGLMMPLTSCKMLSFFFLVGERWNLLNRLCTKQLKQVTYHFKNIISSKVVTSH